MLNRTHLLTAVCLAATAGLFVSAMPAADAVIVSESSTVATPDIMDMKLPAGITSKDLNADKGIEKLFKKSADDALSKNGLDNLVACLVDQDRVRLKKSAGNSPLTNLDGTDNKRLNDLAASLNSAWKTTYKQNFDMDFSKVLTAEFFHIMTGEVDDPQLLARNWPIDSINDTGAPGKLTTGDAQIAKDKLFGGDVNLEKGRGVAVVELATDRTMRGLRASLIHEAGGWKFDIPNNITAQMLHDTLVLNLKYLDLHSADLPADVNDGYRQVAYSVLASLYNVDLSKGRVTAVDSGRPPNTGTVIDK